LKKSAGLTGTFTDEEGKEVVFGDVLKRTVADGHDIGNHTVDHSDLAGLSPEDAARALDENERLINEALVQAGVAPRPLTLVRPPFGSPWHGGKVMVEDVMQAQRAASAIIQDRGVNVLWDIDSSDSREWAQDESFTRMPVDPGRAADAPTYADKVARIKSTVLNDPRVRDGKSVIILMHDTHNATRDALRDIIVGLREAGYDFGRIEELVAARWQRSSLEVTPGPYLYSACIDASDRGCNPRSPGQSHDVCGRMWKVWNDAGGQSVLGAPLGEAMPNKQGIVTQAFEHGAIELHPERAASCSALWKSR
jgi:peptidoglycan/xylan/chitin deacetylase (PgdA/CDA1 family)